ncbi:MAG: tRNA lysidine(34) synthetase TilS, partial [Shewanella sp.]
LRGFIESQGFGLPSYVQLQQILQQLMGAKEDAKVQIQIVDGVLRRFAGMLYLDNVNTASAAPRITARELHQDILALLTQASTRLEDKIAPFSLATAGTRLRLPKANEVVSLRYQLPGQFRCQPHFRDKGRELKKLWQECAVPPWLRADVGFLFYNERLVMALGLWVEKAFCAQGDDVGLKFDGQAIG